MSYDIYGDTLQRGHCEVHPWVHEEYPCSVCCADHAQHQQEQAAQHEYEHQMEQAYNAALSQQFIEEDAHGDGVDPGVM